MSIQRVTIQDGLECKCGMRCTQSIVYIQNLFTAECPKWQSIHPYNTVCPLQHNFLIYTTPKNVRFVVWPPNPKILQEHAASRQSPGGASLHGSSHMDAQGPNRPVHLPAHCIAQSLHHSTILVGSRVRELAAGAHNVCDGYYLCSKWHENSMGGVASTMDVCTSMSYNLWCLLGGEATPPWTHMAL